MNPFVLLLLTVSVVLGGKTMRMWRKEQMDIEHLAALKEMEEKKVQININANLTSITLQLDDRKIWSESLPRRPNKMQDEFGKYASVVVLVLSTVKRPPVVAATRKFMTGQPTEEHKLIVFLKSLQNGRVAILIGSPNFIKYIGQEAKRLLQETGSKYISAIGPSDSWVMIWLTDGGLWEGRGAHDKIPPGQKNVTKTEDFLYFLEMQNHKTFRPMWSGKVLAEALIPKPFLSQRSLSVSLYIDITGKNTSCKWQEIPHMKAQSIFCDTYDGYDTLCSCRDPFVPLKMIKPDSIPMTEEIPIVIVTATKPFHLYRLFRNFAFVRGSAETPILVVIDGYHLETIHLCQLFGYEFRVHKPQGYPKDNTRTNMNIGFSLWAAFHHFSSARKIILLEDDLILSPDLLSFFHQTHHLLDEDETLSHINAFGQNSYHLTAANLSTLLRVDMYPQYGWLTTRRWFHTISSYWVREGKDIDWDWWLSNEGQKMDYHSVVPEVSRTGHAGSSGAHVSGFFQLYYYHTRIQSNSFQEMPQVDTERLSSREKYRKWIDSQIQRATKLWLVESPCSYNIFPQNKTGPFVLYLGVTSQSDGHNAFQLMQTCLGTDETDLKELYDGVMRLNVLPVSKLWQKGKERHILYLVGCPLSSFCKYSVEKSDWIIPQPIILANIRNYGVLRRNISLDS